MLETNATQLHKDGLAKSTIKAIQMEKSLVTLVNRNKQKYYLGVCFLLKYRCLEKI